MLYLTAERFRYQFVEAVRSQDAMAFKEKFRAIDILLIDDLEFMQGEKTEQEFEHIINALLDGGTPGGGGLGTPAGPARAPQRPHALAHAARPDHARSASFDEELRLEDPRAARAGEAADRPVASNSRARCSSCWPSG